VIKPRGLLGLGKGEKTILFSSISSIDFKETGLTSGYIRFCESGHNKSSINVWNAANDTSTFMYALQSQNKDIHRIKDYVEMRLNDRLLNSKNGFVDLKPQEVQMFSESSFPPLDNKGVKAEQSTVGSVFQQIDFNSHVSTHRQQSTNIFSNSIVQRVLIFIGWSLSAFSFILALGGLTIPGAGKIISLAMIGWCLIFLPPLWKKTIKYGLSINFISRVIAFVTIPVLFTIIAIENGYKSSEVSTVKTLPEIKKVPPQVEQSPKISSLPGKQAPVAKPSVVEKAFPTKYSFQKPSSFDIGTPERVFAEYMLAWHEKDWARMANHTQSTWHAGEENPANTLQVYHDTKLLKGFEILKIVRTGEVLTDITYIAWYSFADNKISSRQITARIIKEDGVYNPSVNGEWGVNPTSTLREIEL
jgi:hypothetical protein